MKKEIKQLFDSCPDLPTYSLKLYDKKLHNERHHLLSIADAKDYARKCFDEGKINLHEAAFVIALNRRNKVMGVYPVSVGGFTGTVVDPRSVYLFAILAGATSIILTHNHPSGDKRQSRQDEELTDKIRQAGLLLDIKVLDHIIVTETDALSMNEEGLLY